MSDKTSPIVSISVYEGFKHRVTRNINLDEVKELMRNSMNPERVNTNVALLRQGNSFTFKCNALSVTVKPLVNHIQNY